ncbi:dimethyl sulfoxide reductase anchor subunit [Limibaculum sp. FT325]|uniref:dimethyl sulfoxide reductase anchor subunit family protein n=1 Tax=Thermohalobaculum sediminis TaxID=2939436 RepID=UPI0020BF75D2|nr:DmsC/YnfH family molybdoenzyme membrane anchor subunit [Limibaculum sediminis]MCL5778153.1 dimethyl sulfoxide reductase anchor subunit [Limibaculum sediminis]
MHPAPSIIVFTVLSGLGLGMVFWAGLGLGPDHGAARWWIAVLALGFAAGGGAASAGHLARPDRAWRAFSQWRSSWLSREACLMVAALGTFGMYAAGWTLGGVRFWPVGWIAAGLALATVYATAMIYAQLRTVPRWSLTPTPQTFLAFAGAGGLMGVEAASALGGADVSAGRVLLALALTAGVAVWWQTEAAGAGRRSTGSDIGTATGLGRLGRVRLFEPPHTGSNYLLDEMAYRVGRRRAYQLRLIGAVAGFLVPLALTLLAPLLGGWLMVPALVSHVAGVMALRWLFFAEAEHVQAFYYGMR